MIKGDLISVIIPTHNRKRLLRKAINSVLSQAYKNFEIVIVDDCSSDGTNDFISSLNHKKIRYFRNKNNLFAAASRNIGIRNARGKYLTFLDDDDEILPNKLSEIISAFKTFPDINFVYHRAEIVMVNENNYYITNPSREVNFRDLLIRNVVGGTPLIAVKKDFLTEEFDTSLLALEDYELWLNLSRDPRFKSYFINKVLVKCYYQTEVKSVSKNISNLLNAISLIHKKYDNEYTNLTNKEQKRHKEWINSMIGHKFYLNYNKKGSYFYFKAFLFSFHPKYLFASILGFFSPTLIFRIK